MLLALSHKILYTRPVVGVGAGLIAKNFSGGPTLGGPTPLPESR